MSHFAENHQLSPTPGDRNRAVQGIRELLADQNLGALSTFYDQEPHASLVGFAPSADWRYLYFATPRATRKYRNLVHCGRTALLIDNRNNKLADFHEAHAVTANGRATEPQGAEREQALEIFTQRHPHLVDFVSAPSCALFAIRVETYRFVDRFQQVVEVRFD